MLRFRIALAVLLAASAAACSGGGSFNPASPSAQPAREASRLRQHDASGTLVDGGFESGGTTYWQQCGTVNASVTTAQAHTGSYSDLNGSVSKPEIDGNAGLCQEFVVPAGGTLTFWVYEGTSETSTEYSYQEVDLLSAGARTSTVVAQLDKEVTTTSGWVQRTYSLSAYAGKTVWLYFGVHANGYSSGYIYQYIDDVSVSGTATPTPSPSASPTKTPSPTPSPTKTPSPTPSPTKTPSPTPSPSTSPTKSPAPGNPCTQAQGTGQSSSVSVVAYTTVTGAIASGHEVCLSAYVFTTAMFDALQTAAKNGAKVTVVLPQEEKSTDSSDATALQTAGATIVWDPGSPTDHPLHAKLALVDGVAYLDGRNWDTNDVTITDGVAADYTAITNALNLNPTSSTNLDTLKSNSIAREDAFITGAAPGKGVTVQFMSESFGTDTATNTALENAAKAGATVEVMVLSSDESGNSTEEAVLNTLKADGAQVRLNPASGSEKIALIGGQSTAWFGSANATDSTTSTDNYIDWGMTVTNASVVSSLQSYFNTTWATGTAF